MHLIFPLPVSILSIVGTIRFFFCQNSSLKKYMYINDAYENRGIIALNK